MPSTLSVVLNAMENHSTFSSIKSSFPSTASYSTLSAATESSENLFQTDHLSRLSTASIYDSDSHYTSTPPTTPECSPPPSPIKMSFPKEIHEGPMRIVDSRGKLLRHHEPVKSLLIEREPRVVLQVPVPPSPTITKLSSTETLAERPLGPTIVPFTRQPTSTRPPATAPSATTRSHRRSASATTTSKRPYRATVPLVTPQVGEFAEIKKQVQAPSSKPPQTVRRAKNLNGPPNSYRKIRDHPMVDDKRPTISKPMPLGTKPHHGRSQSVAVPVDRPAEVLPPRKPAAKRPTHARAASYSIPQLREPDRRRLPEAKVDFSAAFRAFADKSINYQAEIDSLLREKRERANMQNNPLPSPEFENYHAIPLPSPLLSHSHKVNWNMDQKNLDEWRAITGLTDVPEPNEEAMQDLFFFVSQALEKDHGWVRQVPLLGAGVADWTWKYNLWRPQYPDPQGRRPIPKRPFPTRTSSVCLPPSAKTILCDEEKGFWWSSFTHQFNNVRAHRHVTQGLVLHSWMNDEDDIIANNDALPPPLWFLMYALQACYPGIFVIREEFESPKVRQTIERGLPPLEVLMSEWAGPLFVKLLGEEVYLRTCEAAEDARCSTKTTMFVKGSVKPRKKSLSSDPRAGLPPLAPGVTEPKPPKFTKPAWLKKLEIYMPEREFKCKCHYQKHDMYIAGYEPGDEHWEAVRKWWKPVTKVEWKKSCIPVKESAAPAGPVFPHLQRIIFIQPPAPAPAPAPAAA